MRLTITLDTGSASFDDDSILEVESCIERVIERMKREGLQAPDSWPVRDTNGNTVGRVTVSDGSES